MEDLRGIRFRDDVTSTMRFEDFDSDTYSLNMEDKSQDQYAVSRRDEAKDKEGLKTQIEWLKLREENSLWLTICFRHIQFNMAESDV